MSQRIVSLIASATEIVCALGLRDRLVGISHECDFPREIEGLPRLSRPKIDPRASSADIDRAVRDLAKQALSIYEIDTRQLADLAPDLVITQDHCRVCAVSVQDLEEAVCSLTLKSTELCTLHPGSLADVRQDLARVARACGVETAGEALVAAFDARLAAVQSAWQQCASSTQRPRVACVEWLDPVMVAGGWLPELVRIAGGEPVIVTEPDRFATVTWDDIAAADPDVVVLMPCGFGIDQTLSELAAPHLLDSLQALRATREEQCWVVDGNAWFNRPGPRLAESAEILAGILHPAAVAPHEAALQWSTL